jgi:exoribonuclease-2
VSKNVFYDEEGDFKVGAILADNETSLQVEAPHGKRSKVKASHVLLRFEDARLGDFMSAAHQLAGDLDVDFLWECCEDAEFSYESLAQDYFGRPPKPMEAAALLIKLHGAPMYFYKKGRGRYRAAPQDALKAALASVERKRREAEKRAEYVARLKRAELPAEFVPRLSNLLYKPEKASTEWKALEEACEALKLTPARLIERCGGIPSTHAYHLDRFLFEYFPRGIAFPDLPLLPEPADLPPAGVEAFSIDDASTTEIDDAFSVTPLANGHVSVGIHIAAPAAGIAPGSLIDTIARERLSTVYFPGAKITMLPEAAVDRFSLTEDGDRPALSLYLELAPDATVISVATRAERIPVAANLRHAELERVLDENALAAGHVEHRYGKPLVTLWRLAGALERARRGDEPELEMRPEYSFYVEHDRVRIVRRQRGTPLDRIVSELMIYVNSAWGRELAAADAAAIYRVQGAGKVRMSTVPAGHEGLGVESYAWASSPLRRYVDLVNQRQLLALTQGKAPPYAAGDEAMLAAMRDFESAYEAYGEFQRNMERYWSLRWLVQEGVDTVCATVLRESLARFDELPLVARVPSLPALAPGTRVELAVSGIDLLELTLRCEYRRQIPAG